MSFETNSHNYTNMNFLFSQFVAADFFKKESRSPRGFFPSPLLRAGFGLGVFGNSVATFL
jgi:hypothetical protein